jgi:hypothetical protein
VEVTLEQADSRGDGRFRPGQSGNPGGRPKGLQRAIREKYGDDGKQLMLAVHKLAFGKKTSDAVRLNALQILIERGWGKAPQIVSGDPENPVGLRVTFGGRYKPATEPSA